ncbi:hypothetical protein SHELI_v1c00970 [Spiroplasma helicoides]|uniref:Transmembrane protein n=1 Tax=Spiroplasma helicoides TaxID=216938 RepID=A0A1B3SJF2_9MOLU|nr:hypothetical protein [Spiroplasma helicoides]AOG60052.1 hypothetical protein SHELI_v1c00970 [Spiroplasma helicoides]
MDFKLIKPILKKPILWLGSGIFAIIIAILVTVFSISISKSEKIVWASQLILNFLLLFLITLLLNLSKTSVSIFLDVYTEKNLETNEIKVEVKKSRYCHIFICLFTIIFFFIELTSGSQIKNVSWAEYAKSNWWVFFIVYIFNIAHFYFLFSFNQYLLNNSDVFKNSYIEWYENTKKEISDKKNKTID